LFVSNIQVFIIICKFEECDQLVRPVPVACWLIESDMEKGEQSTVWQADECKVGKGNFAKPHSLLYVYTAV
jgi:hypothetical protein